MIAVDTVCGLPFRMEAAGRIAPRSDERGKPRVIVHGIVHSKSGKHIRFKSLEKAARHILNMGKGR